MEPEKQKIGFVGQVVPNVHTSGDIFCTTIEFLDAFFSLGAKVLIELGKILLIILGLVFFVEFIKAFLN